MSTFWQHTICTLCIQCFTNSTLNDTFKKNKKNLNWCCFLSINFWKIKIWLVNQNSNDNIFQSVFFFINSFLYELIIKCFNFFFSIYFYEIIVLFCSYIFLFPFANDFLFVLLSNSFSLWKKKWSLCSIYFLTDLISHR